MSQEQKQQQQLTDEQFNSLPEDIKELIYQHENLLMKMRIQEIFTPSEDDPKEFAINWLKEHIATVEKIAVIQRKLHAFDPEMFVETTPEGERVISSPNPEQQAIIDQVYQEMEVTA